MWGSQILKPHSPLSKKAIPNCVFLILTGYAWVRIIVQILEWELKNSGMELANKSKNQIPKKDC